MVTCPWCGTNYLSFQSNCSNCGGPLPLPVSKPADATELLPEAPPAAPRPISDRYARRLLSSDSWSIVAGVFLLLGIIFTVVGAAMTMLVITAIVGLPFVLLGITMLVGGGAVLYIRYQRALKTVQVLKIGEAVLGQITSLDENYSVRVNGRHLWIIRYSFTSHGRQQEGQVTTFNRPGLQLQAGRAVYVLYLPEAPQYNALYPHP